MSDPSVLIIEQDPQTVKLLSIILTSKGFSVMEAQTEQEVSFFLLNNRPDVVLLDLDLEERGFSIRGIQAQCNKPILIVAQMGLEHKVAQAIDQGAMDFLIKPIRSNEVVSRIELVLHPGSSRAQKPVDIFPGLEVPSNTASSEKLTEIEAHLLSLFIHSEGRVFTQNTLMRKVIGESTENGRQVLISLIAGLRKKIERDPGRPEHIITETGIGYRFYGPTPSHRGKTSI